MWPAPEYSHSCGTLPNSSASQDSGSLFSDKPAAGRRSFSSTWFTAPPAAAAEATQPTITASSSSSSVEPSSDTESSQIRSPTQKQSSSDQGQLETLYEGPPESPTATLKLGSPYRREFKKKKNGTRVTPRCLLLAMECFDFGKRQRCCLFRETKTVSRALLVSPDNLNKGSGVPRTTVPRSTFFRGYQPGH